MWGALGRQELCLAPLARTRSPGLSCLCFSPPERIWVITPPTSSQSRARLRRQTLPVASHFQRESTAHREAPPAPSQL